MNKLCQTPGCKNSVKESRLIELGDNEVGSLDDHLPRLLLKFGIVVD